MLDELMRLLHEVSPYDGHDLAAHPEDLQGWGSEDQVFEAAIAAVRPNIIVEVGTWKGASAIHMARVAQRLGLPSRIICVDTWLGSTEHFMGTDPTWRSSLRLKNGYPQLYFTFLSNVISQNLTDRIIPLPATSENAAEILRAKGIRPDLVYIDAAHSYGAVLRDLRLFWELLNDNGILLGDDYIWSPDVTRAANDFAAEIGHTIVGKQWKFTISKDPRLQPVIRTPHPEGATAAAISPSQASANTVDVEQLQAKLQEGAALHQQGQLAQAQSVYDQILKLQPRHFDALHLSGVIAAQTENPARAVELISRAIEINPNEAAAHANRGNALLELKEPQAALESYDRAIALKPDYAEAHNYRGAALTDLNRPEEALASYDKALAIRADYAEASYNRGGALREMNRPDEAVASYSEALAVRPDFAKALFSRCMAELAILYRDELDIATRRKAYERRLRALSGGEDTGVSGSANLADGVGSLQPFLLPYMGYNDLELQSLYGSFVCRIMAERYPPAVLPPPPVPDEPVRVGIVSGFFQRHTVWKLLIKGWLGQLDRQQFRLFGYHTDARRDAETAVAAAMCHRFVHGPLPLDRWRAEILADAPHVLIYPEIGMDPIAACRPAAGRGAVQFLGSA